MKKTLFLSASMLLAASYTLAQENMVVYTSDSIMTYPISINEPLSVDIKPNELKPTFDPERKLFVVEDASLPAGKIEPDEEDDIARKLENYAIDMLLDYNQDKGKNTIISPVNATALFSMISNLTSDNVSKQLFSYMGLAGHTKEQVNAYTMNLNDKFNEISEKNDEKASFSVDNEMLINENGTIYKSFLSLANNYNVALRGESASNIRNIIAKNHSDGSRPRYIQTGDNYLSETSAVVSSNMDFQVGWDGEIITWGDESSFVNALGDTTACQMLGIDMIKNGWQFGRFDHFAMMELPCKSNLGKFNIYIVLPGDGYENTKGEDEPLDDEDEWWTSSSVFLDNGRGSWSKQMKDSHNKKVEENDASDKMKEALLELRERGIENCIRKLRKEHDDVIGCWVNIPKFKIEGTINLNPDENSISYNTQQLFTSNMPKASPSTFHINDISQKFFIQLDEHGTYAKVQTEVEGIYHYEGEDWGTSAGEPDLPAEASADYWYYDFDRPFIMIIRENNNNFITHACCINNLKGCTLFSDKNGDNYLAE